MIPAVTIVGNSGSGKTRVAYALIRAMTGRGYRVAAIKHASHGHSADRAGSDSARFTEAGARRVMVSSPDRITCFIQVPGEQAIEELLLGLPPSIDVVIAEGFKRSSLPKILVLGGAELRPPVSGVIASAGDDPAAADGSCPRYRFDEMTLLADQVEREIVTASAVAPPVSMTIDGVPVSLRDFPTAVLSGIIRGYVGALKGIPANPRQVQVSIDLGLGGPVFRPSHGGAASISMAAPETAI